ncbi:MAG: prolipoprotein diacylglyceryl transferase [Clostridia bacterium]|nr:prolipoprotein diacylglyceryl transferase [Clostridia bacterium]
MSFLAINPGFTLFGFHIAWYGVIMASAMVIAVLLCITLAKRRGLTGDDFIAPALWALPSAIIGARAMYVLFPPEGVGSYTFIEALQIWNGGLSIWGGVLGGAIGLFLYCLIFKKDFLARADIIAPTLIFAQSIGRWGNFLNQEAYGWEVTNPTYFGLPFSVFIEAEGAWHMATFLYEALLNTLGFVALLIILLKTRKRGLITAIYLMIYGTVRSIIEIFRTDPLLLGPIKMSQLISFISIIIGLSLLLYIIVRDRKLREKGIDPYSPYSPK